MKNIFVYPLLIVLVAGCDRLAKDNSAKIQIQLPTAASVSSKIETYGYGTQPIPDGLSGVAGVNTPINCYIIAYSGPEAELSRNTCTRDDGSKKFNIGQWAGGITPGETVALDVPSGKNRTFYVIGVHAAPGYCKDFKAGFPEDDLLSKPYILGKVEGVTLNAGETKELPIPVAFSTTEYFDDCVGPDFPSKNGGGNGGTITPTAIKLSKDYFPHNIIQQYTCQALDISLVDSAGRTGTVSHPVSFEVNVTGVGYTTYKSMEDCNNGIPESTFTIPANQYFGQFVINASTGSSSITISTKSISSITPLTVSSATFSYLSDSTKTLEIDSPESLLPGQCYPTPIYPKAVLNQYQIESTALGIDLTSVGVSVYSDSQCIGTPITSTSIPANQPSKTVYLKIDGQSGIAPSISMTRQDNSVTTKRTLRRGSGDTIVKYLQIIGPNQMGGGNVCHENVPYKVIAQNSHGTPIITTTAIPFALSTIANVAFHLDSGCSGTAPSGIASGSYFTNFFLENIGGASGSKEISLSTTGTITVIPYNIYIQP